MKYILWLIIFGLAISVGTRLGAQAMPIEDDLLVSQEISALLTPTPIATGLPNLPAAEEPMTTPAPTRVTVPASFLIDNVPFIEQAPHKNWDATHGETCEEASILTVVHYLRGDRTVDPNQQETELQALVSWQMDRFGDFEDTTTAQTATILRDYYGLGDRVRMVTLAGPDDLLALLASGRPVIVPAAGRLLENRYFKRPGPIYHMTVAIGYDADTIITNDPGTQHGERYRYPREQFWQAIHDFVDRTDEGMTTGAKRVIVIDPTTS